MEEVIELTQAQKKNLANLINRKKNKFYKYLLYTIPVSIIAGFYYENLMGEISIDILESQKAKFLLFIIVYAIDIITEQFLVKSDVFGGVSKKMFVNDKNIKCTLVDTDNIKIREKNNRKHLRENREIIYQLRGQEELASDLLGNTIDVMLNGESGLAIIEYGIYKWEVAFSLIDNGLLF